MKKFLALMLAAVMMFSFAACGGEEVEETTETTTTVVEEVEEEEITLVERTTGNVSMLLPSDFTDFTAYEGYSVAAGPGASVVVAEMGEYLMDSTTMTEEDFLASTEGVYENVEIVEFGPSDINGAIGVVGTFIGDSVSSGETRSVLYAWYDTTDGTTDYNNSICFVFNTNAGTSLETYFEDVLGSVNVLGE
ncbi:MAG: hypothetical protein E7235_07085 [Lachnospiraceae bacterium]|nr:hypothetical protein [Lachnospiraceae bacterium]